MSFKIIFVSDSVLIYYIKGQLLSSKIYVLYDLYNHLVSHIIFCTITIYLKLIESQTKEL